MAVTPPKKPSAKGTPPTAAAVESSKAKSNTEKPGSSDLVPMNFAVEAEFRKQYKMFAAMHEVNMVDILKESFELYKQSKGSA